MASPDAHGRFKPPDNSVSYHGVCWHKRKNGWMAQAKKHNNRWFCMFDDPIEAAQVRDAAAKLLFGPDAKLNFPERDGRPPPNWPIGKIMLALVDRGLL